MKISVANAVLAGQLFVATAAISVVPFVPPAPPSTLSPYAAAASNDPALEARRVELCAQLTEAKTDRTRLRMMTSAVDSAIQRKHFATTREYIRTTRHYLGCDD